jgi:Domain of unknown function (DUF1127)
MTQFFQPVSLVRELADHDDHQLLDIGLVRAADGSLRLAADPAQPAAPAVEERRFTALSGIVRGLIQAVRAVPFHSSASGPVILTPQ